MRKPQLYLRLGPVARRRQPKVSAQDRRRIAHSVQRAAAQIGFAFPTGHPVVEYHLKPAPPTRLVGQPLKINP